MFGINRRYLADFDWLILGVALSVAAFGVLEISSAEPFPGLWRKQVVGIMIGVMVLFAVTAFDYRRVVNLAPYLYVIGVGLLLLVFTSLGREFNGNRNWLYFGKFGFQPSEFAKIFTILYLAYYLSGVKKRPLDLRTITTAGLIWAVPTVLVFMGNDTGSGLSFISFLAAMLFLAGVRWRWLIATAGVIVLTLVIFVPSIKACKSYKCERIKAVYWPELAEKRFRYQNEQSEIAVGSGGIVGKGFGGSTQGPLGFLPEVYSDFIYAVASEETGFVGSFASLSAYLLIIIRLIQIARRARERVGLLLVAGFAALLLYHVTVNVGMVVRLLPIMGIPLPLMSFGSTSVVATCFGLGLAISVRLRRFVN
ncbi:MAG: FtsW/RodA/SpoVE family cell cycle protein [Acidobacteria bacterium]|nr:FtsW/RodA/SpoVE family cell cycle protein [Acidobacteriota bacterium]